MLQVKKNNRNAFHHARAIAVVNGKQIRFQSFTVEQSGFSAADSFELTLPFFITNKQTKESILANGASFQTDLLVLDVISVKLYIGYVRDLNNYSINDLKCIMDGYMDTASWNFSLNDGETVTLRGRNIVGKMIDSKIVDKYPNMTASAIADMFAKKYGLSTGISPTASLAGSYYNENSTVMPTTEMSEWDLLQFLAKQENFICRVKNNTLYFGPYSMVTGYTSSPLIYTWGDDIESLEIERSPHAARDIVVKVVSYDRNGQHKIVETAKSNTQKAGSASGQLSRKQEYVETYIIPGLTREQAQKKAWAIYNELSRSELIGQISVSGNPEVEIDRLIELHGVGIGLSQDYYINSVTHSFSLDSGYGIEMSFSNQYMPNQEEST